MLELKKVSKFYNNDGNVTTGFIKVDLKLKVGEFVIITGESGSGKTTLLNVISGLDNYDEGEMYINGKETSHYNRYDFEEYRKKYIANIFQDFNLINSYTVYQNIELMMLLNGHSKKNIKKNVLEIIDKVGLTNFKNTKVSKLSGGQKQRVAIARAVVKDTPIIVADEPTGNLDTKSAQNVIEILKNIAKDKLVIIVTHNLEQFEKYATRIIKMHDGEIIENKEIKNVEDNIKIKECNNKNISFKNIIRLGIRNTFNIKTKFILLFLVFFLVTSTLFFEYSNFKFAEYQESLDGTSMYFKDMSENRILIKKADKTSFSQEDYNNIKELSNIDYIVENDLFLDCNVMLERSSVYGDIDFNCSIESIDYFKEKLDIGKMPEAEDEIILQTSQINQKIKTSLDQILDKRFSIGDYLNGSAVKNLKVVGIIFNEKIDNYDSKIYVSNSIIKELNSFINKKFSTTSILKNNEYSNAVVFPSENVEKGKAVVNENFGDNLNGENLTIKVSNIYCEEELNLTINNTFSINNFQNYTGYSNYQLYAYGILINKEDYENLYNLPNYQSSVFVKDINNIDKTISDLNNIGINTKRITEYKTDDIKTNEQILKIVKVIVTIALIFILLLISYFVIKMILKSRNTYYAILRILGTNFKTEKWILNIELLIVSSFAYLVILAIIYLFQTNIIVIKYINNLVKFITIKEYIFVYIINLLITGYISIKISKNIFKKTAINTFNEEEI